MIEEDAGFYFFVKNAAHALHNRSEGFSRHPHDKKCEHEFDPSERFHFQDAVDERFGVEHRFVFGNARQNRIDDFGRCVNDVHENDEHRHDDRDKRKEKTERA